MNVQLNRRALAECLQRLRNADSETIAKDEEFQFFHKNRNFFNTLGQEGTREKISELTQIDDKTYTDQYNRKWTEILIGIMYHRPFFGKGYDFKIKEKVEFMTDFMKPRSERYSRKFICPDPFMKNTAYDGGCEFEIIVRAGFRDVSGEFMETYNFGKTSFTSTAIGLHGKFDVNPHKLSPVYVTDHYPSLKMTIRDNFSEPIV